MSATAQRREMPDAGEIADRLARNIERLAPQLLSAGRRNGAYWKCGSTDNEAGQSLFVHLTGPKAGRWQDASTGEFGDALDLVAAVQCRGDKKAAYAWGLAWLGGDVVMATVPKQERHQAARAAAGLDDERRRRAAQRIWLEAQGLTGTPAAAYFAARGIDLAAIGRLPRALRFHPSLSHRDSGRSFPAIVAAVCGPDGEHAATHRTWLQQDAAGTWRKARVTNPKMTLGNFAGGSIRIWRGASGKPLREAPADEPVVIGEGIETSLSVAVAVPEYRVLCAVSMGNMGSVALPAQVKRVILAADNDHKAGARLGFQRVVERHLEAGRDVRVARAEIGKDFNDTLVAWG
jgi:hypothetical protein